MAELNKNELEAMRILWDEQAPRKPAEIGERFGWPIENATLRSVLRALVQRGLVERRKQGKAYYYKAKASRDGQLSHMVHRLAEVFSGGSSADLILQLVRSEKLSADDLAELQQLAAQQMPSRRRKRS